MRCIDNAVVSEDALFQCCNAGQEAVAECEDSLAEKFGMLNNVEGTRIVQLWRNFLFYCMLVTRRFVGG
jgi:hypothetical protein